jgi:hypothetical protein
MLETSPLLQVSAVEWKAGAYILVSVVKRMLTKTCLQLTRAM